MADVKSFRIDDQTADKIKEIAGEIGGNQQETISKLIEAYEFQKGKSALPEKKADIEQFERYSHCLTSMYMRVLEDNENITSTVRTEFESLLKSKDVTIQDLQGKLEIKDTLTKEMLEELEEQKEQAEKVKAELETLKNENNEKIAGLTKILAEKEKMNALLADSCENLKMKNEQLLQIGPELDNLKVEYEKALQENTELNNKKAELEKELAEKENLYQKDFQSLQEKATVLLQETKSKAELEKEKLRLELEKEYQEQLQEFVKQKQQEIDLYQKKYFELLEKMPVQQKRTKAVQEKKGI